MPPAWKTAPFDEFLVLQRGKDLTKSEFQPGNVPVAGSNGVIGYHNKANVAPPGVTVGRSGSVGKVSIYRRPFWAHNTCLYVRDFLGNDEVFSYFFLQYLNVGRFKSGASVPTLDRNTFRLLPVMFPPIAEQRKIARLLSAVQRAIERQVRLIALTTELKKALMHKLFTEGTRREPLKQTKIGQMPESWTVTSLGELCKKPNGRIQTGPFGSILHKNEYQDVGTPIVNPVHLINNQIDHTDVPRIGESAAQRLHRYRLKKNDLLFGRRGDIGRHAIVSEAETDWFCGTGCFIVRVSDPRIDAQFLNVFLSNERVISWLQSHAAGVIMPNLSNKVLERLPIGFPNRVEQAAIAAAMRAVDAKGSAYARIAATLSELFRTLLYQLMTAQVRVHDLDLSAFDELAVEIAEVT